MANLDDTPQGSRERLRDALARRGDNIVIRRYETDGGYTEATVRARVVGADIQEFTDSMQQRRRKVIALVDPDAIVPDDMVSLSSLLPLVPTDKAVVRDRELAIEGIDDDARRLNGTLIGLEFWVVG